MSCLKPSMPSEGYNHKQARKIERSWKTVAKCYLYDLCSLKIFTATIETLKLSQLILDKKNTLVVFSVETASSSAVSLELERICMYAVILGPLERVSICFFQCERFFCRTHSKMSISRLLFPLGLGVCNPNSASRFHGRFFLEGSCMKTCSLRLATD